MAKYIIAFHPTIHLGIIKETFGSGSVIDHDVEEGRLIIDGRRFDQDRDMEVLLRQSRDNPHRPWIVPYSEESFAKIKAKSLTNQEIQPGKSPPRAIPIVQSDADSHKTIDISDTQVSKQNMAVKEAEQEAIRNRDVNSDLPVIRGDETPSEVRVRQSVEGAMPIVKDDSLGYAGGGKYDALNTGQQVSGNTKDSASGQNAQSIAEGRKKDAERVRVESGVSLPVELPSVESEASQVISQQAEQEAVYPVDSLEKEVQRTQMKTQARVDSLEKEVVGIRDDMSQVLALLRDGHPRVAVTKEA